MYIKGKIFFPWLFVNTFQAFFKKYLDVGELTCIAGTVIQNIGQPTSYVGKLVVGELSRWRIDRLPIIESSTKASIDENHIAWTCSFEAVGSKAKGNFSYNCQLTSPHEITNVNFV